MPGPTRPAVQEWHRPSDPCPPGPTGRAVYLHPGRVAETGWRDRARVSRVSLRAVKTLSCCKVTKGPSRTSQPRPDTVCPRAQEACCVTRGNPGQASLRVSNQLVSLLLPVRAAAKCDNRLGLILPGEAGTCTRAASSKVSGPGGWAGLVGRCCTFLRVLGEGAQASLVGRG